MIGISKETIHSIPCLIVSDQQQLGVPLPTVVYLHGFTSAKEHNLPFAFLLAEKGYRVILPDSQYHGEREFKLGSLKRYLSFWDIVIKNVDELQMIKNVLDKHQLIQGDRFGIAGTSMGGITTSAALTQYPWIKAAAILMGTPKITTYAEQLVTHLKQMGHLPVKEDKIDKMYEQLKAYDLSMHTDTLMNRPVMFWHGTDDSVVPFEHAYTFYKEVKNHYKTKRNIHFVKEENRDHKVSRFAILETVKWFEKFL
ncbi:MAG TPA: alpha/beta fold hydrolase [Bacillota bacterium]